MTEVKRRGRPPLSVEEKARRAEERRLKKIAEAQGSITAQAEPARSATNKTSTTSKPIKSGKDIKGKVDMKHPTRMILPNHQVVNVANKDSEIIKGVLGTFDDYISELMTKNPYDMNRSDLRQLIQFYLLVEKNSVAFGNRTLSKLTLQAPDGVIETFIARNDEELVGYLSQSYKVIDLSYIKESKELSASGTVYILSAMSRMLKNIITKILDSYTMMHPLGRYMRTFRSVGPLTAAVLIAYFNIENYPRVTQWWAYAGLSPDQKKTKGELANWNSQLRMLLWRCTDPWNYVKDGTYDPQDPAYYFINFYHKRKEYETALSDKGVHRDLALGFYEAGLRKGKLVHDGDEAEFRSAMSYWKEGKLNPGHIKARAIRYATKRLISGAYEYMYCLKFGKLPDDYYPIAKLPGHTHYEGCPNMEEYLQYGRDHIDIAFK